MLVFCTLTLCLKMFTGNVLLTHASAASSDGDLKTASLLAATQSPLNISILSPENATYSTSDVLLRFTASAPFSWAGYSLDAQTNVTIVGNTTMSNLQQGPHSLVVYANDTAGSMKSSRTVDFTVGQLSTPEIAFLGVLQGLTEWLPVSSTAHLLVAEHLLGFPATPLFDVALHIGTLVVVVFYFRREIKDILAALAHLNFGSEYGRLILPIVIATIPTGIIGLMYVELLEKTFQTILIIGVTLLVGATILYTSRIGKENTDAVTVTTAFIMGAAQGLAVFPGLSRSGVTISTALLLGLKREKAFKFSFLLSIPAILGDLVVEAYHQRGQLALGTVGPIQLLIGIIFAMVAGYVAIRLVSNTMRSKKFHYFALYTWPLGIALIVLTLSGLLTI